MKKALLIYNPRSGVKSVVNNMPAIVDLFTAAGYLLTLLPLSKRIRLGTLMKEYKDAFDLFLISGGDGSLNSFINVYKKNGMEADFAYIPSGTTNGFARTLAISSDVLEACRQAIHGSPFEFDLGKLNDRYFCYISAFGAFTAISYDTPQSIKNVLGYAAYAADALLHIPDCLEQSCDMEITIDGEEKLAGRYLFGAVCNTSSIGGIEMGIDMDISDGRFELLLVEAPKNMLELNDLAVQFLSRNLEDPRIRLCKFRELKLVSKEKTPWTIDGEYGGELDEVSITVEEKALRILR